MSQRDRYELHDSPIGPVMVAKNAPAGTVAFFTGAAFDGFLKDGGAQTLRSWVRDSWNLDAPLVTCHQVHGTSLAQAPAGGDGWQELPECDAVWSRERRHMLAIKVADCVALLLRDPESGVSAGVHAGWRGASAGIVPKVLEGLAREAGLNPSSTLAWIGPAIRNCCFEVGEEVIEAMMQRVPEAGQWVDRSKGQKPHFDLGALVRADLLSAGLREENVSDSGVCTRCSEAFHSYRRGAANAGRNLAVIAVQSEENGA